MTTYSMTPIKNGTRLRSGHDVFASVIIGDFNPNDLLLGDEVWTCPFDSIEARKNDQWLYVTHRNGIELEEKGWTAIIHKGVPICNNFKEVGIVTPPPPPVTTFPQSFILTDPATGKSANFIFDREL